MYDITETFFGSYEEAVALCPFDAYRGRDLVKVVIEKNRIFREGLSKNPIFDLVAARTLIGLAFADAKNTTVLDFGGGGGYHYTLARIASRQTPSSRLTWGVVETPEMVAAAKPLENDELSFFDSIESAALKLGKVDLIFTSGALGYSGEPLETLRRLLSVGAKKLFITRTCLNHSGERIVKIQRSLLSQNGPGPLPAGFEDREVFYPIVCESLVNVENLISTHGYSIAFRMIEEPAVKGKDGPLYMFGYFAELLA